MSTGRELNPVHVIANPVCESDGFFERALGFRMHFRAIIDSL